MVRVVVRRVLADAVVRAGGVVVCRVFGQDGARCASLVRALTVD
jgi:hypothetical protein